MLSLTLSPSDSVINSHRFSFLSSSWTIFFLVHPNSHSFISDPHLFCPDGRNSLNTAVSRPLPCQFTLHRAMRLISLNLNQAHHQPQQLLGPQAPTWPRVSPSSPSPSHLPPLRTWLLPHPAESTAVHVVLPVKLRSLRPGLPCLSRLRSKVCSFLLPISPLLATPNTIPSPSW